jgi:hypothetical protein
VRRPGADLAGNRGTEGRAGGRRQSQDAAMELPGHEARLCRIRRLAASERPADVLDRPLLAKLTARRVRPSEAGLPALEQRARDRGARRRPPRAAGRAAPRSEPVWCPGRLARRGGASGAGCRTSRASAWICSLSPEWNTPSRMRPRATTSATSASARDGEVQSSCSRRPRAGTSRAGCPAESRRGIRCAPGCRGVLRPARIR